MIQKLEKKYQFTAVIEHLLECENVKNRKFTNEQLKSFKKFVRRRENLSISAARKRKRFEHPPVIRRKKLKKHFYEFLGFAETENMSMELEELENAVNNETEDKFPTQIDQQIQLDNVCDNENEDKFPI